MLRGDKESKLFNIVKNNFENSKTFGLSKKDEKELSSILKIATPNNKPNDFPDFLFHDGFIEVFQVTSSKENRNGSKHIKDKSVYQKDVNNLKQKVRKGLLSGHVTKKFSCDTGIHSHENLKCSIIKNFENHLKSLSNYDIEYSIGIFLIYYEDFALEMAETISSKSEVFHDYLISKDDKILSYIERYSDILKYVIFVNSSGDIECLNLNQLKKFISSKPKNTELTVIPRYYIEKNSFISFDI